MKMINWKEKVENNKKKIKKGPKFIISTINNILKVIIELQTWVTRIYDKWPKEKQIQKTEVYARRKHENNNGVALIPNHL